MTEGLKLIKLPGWDGPTRIGWLKHVRGNDYVLLPGARAVWRTSGSRLLEHLAFDGPLNDHTLAEPAKGLDEINKDLVWRSLPAEEEAWAKFCPRPPEFDRP